MSLFCLFVCFFFPSILLRKEERLVYIKLTVVFWKWNSSRLANPQEAKILRFLSPGSDSEPNLIKANPNYFDWLN